MSAVKEWFGGYNTIFRYMRDQFGAEVLDEYIRYIADDANSDISDKIRAGTLEEAADWFAANFRKDEAGIEVSRGDGAVIIEVGNCAAYDFMNHSTNPYFKPDPDFCDCCVKLNRRICENAGISLEITDVSRSGLCRWTFSKKEA